MNDQITQPQTNNTTIIPSSMQQPTISPTVLSLQSPETQPITINAPEAFIKPSTPELILHPEVHEAGARSIPTNPAVTQDQQNVGIQPAKEATPVITQPSGKITLPFTQPKAEEIIKHDKDTRDSALWLATLVIYHLHAQALRQQEKNAQSVTSNTQK